ncbi:hypothetical protein [Paraburkholderia sp. DGU8]|jgi:acetate kinase|uniref:hypothetical protein n=1 Tax=Paraburkholderia sp. DGU8 TaxID=3161997 RepID=UPI003467B746
MDVILVMNSGSSSIKFEAFSVSGGTREPIAGGKLEEQWIAAGASPTRWDLLQWKGW